MSKRVVFGSGTVILLLSLGLAVRAIPHGKDPWPAPPEAKKLKNPVATTPESLAAAKALYMDQCAQCHGDEGKGDGPEAPMYSVKPADFSDSGMMSQMTDGEIFWKIGEGRRPMPSFKKRLTEEQRWHLVIFVRAFAPKPAADAKSTGGKKTPAHKP